RICSLHHRDLFLFTTIEIWKSLENQLWTCCICTNPRTRSPGFLASVDSYMNL
ncbi:hypothetical protein LINPERPRIM_LOCUS6157, partial [Linum perenne]